MMSSLSFISQVFVHLLLVTNRLYYHPSHIALLLTFLQFLTAQSPGATILSTSNHSRKKYQKQPIAMAPGASTNQTIREFYAPRNTASPSQQPMPASSKHHDIRGFYGPRTTQPLRTSQQQSMPRVEHQTDAGLLGEIKNYKSGDEFVLLWKWVDDFMDKRRAKNKSSNTDNVKKSTSRQLKPTTSTRVGQAPRPVVTPSPEAVRRQATDREDMREYNAQRHTPWGELSYLYQNWKDQQAKKKADRARQGKPENIAKSQVTNRRDDAPRGRSTNPREHPQPTLSSPDQHSQPAVAGIPKPVYNKKRGEVKQHTVTIAQLPPVHNSVHLQHTPSNNYGTGPSRGGQKDRSTRDTRFSDFVHQRKAPPSQKPAPSREKQWTYTVPGQDDEFARNSRKYSSVLDPAKAKKAQEAQKAQSRTVRHFS